MPWFPSVSCPFRALGSKIELALAILYYDYFLTIGIEFERYWRLRPFKWNWGIALFFFVRYVGVWGHIPVLISSFLTEHDTPVSHFVAQHVFSLTSPSTTVDVRSFLTIHLSPPIHFRLQV